MSETPAAPQLTGKMFLFNRPELVSKEQHGDLRLSKPAKHYNFCATARAVPVTVSEIPQAAKDYPIVFAGQDQWMPLAILGLVDEVNLFVDENGDWERHRYIPGYIRRYPFGIASEAGGERFAVVLDAGYEGLSKTGDLPLFDNGEPTETAQQAIDYCRTYEEDRQRTVEFARRVKELDIVRPQAAQFTPAGASEPQSFAEYLGVDENELRGLSDEKIIELKNANMLAILYAMLMSMANWRNILQRRVARFNLTEANVLNPAVN
ncbi:MAG: SapC family protein [Pseudomonadota bacterium]